MRTACYWHKCKKISCQSVFLILSEIVGFMKERKKERTRSAAQFCINECSLTPLSRKRRRGEEGANQMNIPRWKM